jgi:GNAT superfamily N-acetyltransferase
MSYLIRKAVQKDVSQLGKLLDAYVRETYQGAWGGNVGLLERHLIENAVEMLLAETPGRETVAFIAWTYAYDLHWCMKGGLIVDLYVCPAHRGRGAAVLLAVCLAEEIQKRGGTFLHGGAVENAVVHRLYNRVAMVQPNGECYVSGRAFRHLANLSGKSVREIVVNLPEAAWNYEP